MARTATDYLAFLRNTLSMIIEAMAHVIDARNLFYGVAGVGIVLSSLNSLAKRGIEASVTALMPVPLQSSASVKALHRLVDPSSGSACRRRGSRQ